MGAWKDGDAGIGYNHAGIATPVTSAQCVSAWVRAERMSVALAGGGQPWRCAGFRHGRRE